MSLCKMFGRNSEEDKKQESWKAYISTTTLVTTGLLTLFDTNAPAATLTTAPYAFLSLSVALTSDGRKLYVANRLLPTVSVFLASTIQFLVNISTFSGMSGPDAVDIIATPLPYKRVYVSNQTSRLLTVLSSETDTFLGNVLLSSPGDQLNRLSITPDGSKLFVGLNNSGQVLILDVLSNPAAPVVLASIAVGSTPGMTSITPDGKFAYIVALHSSSLTVVNTQTFSTSSVLLPNSGFFGSSLLPNGTLLFLVNIMFNSVSIFNLATQSITQTIALPSPVDGPFWAAATPDSKTVFVIDSGFPFGNIAPIDTATLTVGPILSSTSTGIYQDIEISPDYSPVACFTARAIDWFGCEVEFDASESFSPIGTILSYTWVFGDGSSVETTRPIVCHTYGSHGCFCVSLQVTNSAGTSTSQVWSSRFMSQLGSHEALCIKCVDIPFRFLGCFGMCHDMS